MGAHRKALRAAVMEALAADLRFGAFTPVTAWAQGVDDDALPAYGCTTPAETSTRAAPDLMARRVELIVMVKRMGADDLEDALDDDAAAIEAAVGGAIDPLAVNWHLAATRMMPSGEAGSRAGSAMLTFSVLIHTET